MVGVLEKENLILKSENCIVCVLDILGYKDLVKKKSPEGVYKIILDQINIYFKEDKELSADNIIRIKDLVNLQVISDTFLFVLDLDNLPDIFNDPRIDKEKLWIKIFLGVISSISTGFISKEGYFIRGGITKGQYYQRQLNNEKNQFIFSEAFNAAYFLERNFADVPRILIDKGLYKHITKGTNPGYIKRDVDGFYYLNIYWYGHFHLSPERFKEILSGIVDGVKLQVDGIKSIESEEGRKIIRKYYWFQNYHKQELEECFKGPNAKIFEGDRKSLEINIDSYLKDRPEI